MTTFKFTVGTSEKPAASPALLALTKAAYDMDIVLDIHADFTHGSPKISVTSNSISILEVTDISAINFSRPVTDTADSAVAYLALDILIMAWFMESYVARYYD